MMIKICDICMKQHSEIKILVCPDSKTGIIKRYDLCPDCLISAFEKILNYLYRDFNDLNVYGMILEEIESQKQRLRRR